MAFLIILIIGLSSAMFKVAPLGKLLDPFIGAVQNGRESGLTVKERAYEHMGVKDSVLVLFDDRKVPHIYAANTHDLYYTQGYVTANLRLWQMDFVSYASAGRLSELFSTGFFDYDRNQRRLGILQAARRSLELIKKDPETSAAITAYTEGVNAYIKQLKYSSMPLEYKLLDYEPEPWTELKTVLIMKSMANTLSGYEEDFSMSNLMLALGEEKFNKLFPDFPTSGFPVVDQPGEKKDSLFDYIKKPAYLDYSFLIANPVISNSTYNPKLGSNSWVVSGKKTATGFPILCNDPHLGLSLPNIWIEMQLTCPGVNVYGVSIPGTPAIIIGFNKTIAWGLTNGADDVKDWYKLRVKEDYSRYELDGRWVEMKSYVEAISRKDQKVFLDTIYYTAHGPIVFDKSFPGKNSDRKNFSLRWQLHEPSNEFSTFIKLNRSENYTDYKAAIRSFSCPIQNFTFACNDNTIAVNHQGSIFKKIAGEGKFVMDGSISAGLHKEYIPVDSLPGICNPASNYIVSANQHPTSKRYSYYYNGYYSENRASRIQEMLSGKQLFNIKDMQTMQLDNTNSFAVKALPELLKQVDRSKLSQPVGRLLSDLAAWKGNYDFTNENARLFELWWKYIKEYTWDEFNEFPFYAKRPDDFVLLHLISSDPGNSYFDKRETSEKENAQDIIYHALLVAAGNYDKLKKETGVQWGNQNRVNIMHLTNLPAFSSMQLPSAGYSEAINAVSSSWGPSWRMIVELGDRPTAVGIYPGGQSGNIGSLHYDNFVNDWNKGKYYRLLFFMNKQEARVNCRNSWILK